MPKRSKLIPDLPSRQTAPPTTALGRWFLESGEHRGGEHATHPWYLVLWLTGVDYFSTLGYQPGIALLAAGAMSPLATAVLIAVTLLGALPIYAEVARRSYVGLGSIAMLENLLPGWDGKIFVLVLLGFATTDFVITMTLSAADAAQHAIENPFLHPYLGDARMSLTIGLLALLAAVFLKGFQEAIRLATAVVIPYLILNVVVIVGGLWQIAWHPNLMAHWRADLAVHGDWTMLLLGSALIFPKLALGMSGFETGVSVMPLVAGSHGGDRKIPMGRILATRKLLAAAALIMSVMLLLSSFITTLLIPESAFRLGGPASGRAIAYLAHILFGDAFGTVYDFSTILILWFAGASAMAGLLNLIPRYLPRFGMAPRWVAHPRPLVVLLFVIDVVVTRVFGASVEAQGGAYATGVLFLMLSAAIAVALALRKEKASILLVAYFWLVSAVFTYTLIDNVIERPDGVIISSVFIACVMTFSLLSRYRRSTELRVSSVSFLDEASHKLWHSIVGKKVNLVPVRTSTEASCAKKTDRIRKYYTVEGPLAFVHVRLLDNRSEFASPLQLRLTPREQGFLIEISGSVAIANTIAYISELIDPISIFLELTRQNLMEQSLRYIFWGEGETALMVYT
ncbi:MAG: hypothetical protein ACRD9L_18205, partial [Bryobacteraceae bacterium]